ncbi:SsgA family sporulation/cell division regulator [Streptomyces sp. H28]|uniref:SsgA family sporulation/cell division regulator n=1 Tax=Streptomyces sp. H28 TaxID=2775865 RepID=UPI00177D4CA0|nr:SsgA family sporulation/cell division regulator [Streptomyces sp. H28]MBD9733572.1 SsgA family sporulation/cell division regulator [Streptomyces sp. H28]
MSVVEQYARAHVVTDADPLLGDRGAVPVVLRYDPESDPRSVRVALPGSGEREWTVPRELLEEGLHLPAGQGEVQVWPCGRVQTVVEFHTARGVSVVQFENKVLTRFLRRTYAAAAEPVAH